MCAITIISVEQIGLLFVCSYSCYLYFDVLVGVFLLVEILLTVILVQIIISFIYCRNRSIYSTYSNYISNQFPLDSWTVTASSSEAGISVIYDASQEQIDAAYCKYTEGGLDADAASALLKALLAKEVELITGFPEGVTVEQGAVVKGLLGKLISSNLFIF